MRYEDAGPKSVKGWSPSEAPNSGINSQITAETVKTTQDSDSSKKLVQVSL